VQLIVQRGEELFGLLSLRKLIESKELNEICVAIDGGT
jgi:hypothetical protein